MSITKRIKRKQAVQTKTKDKKLMRALIKEDIENYDFKSEMVKVLNEMKALLNTANDQEKFLVSLVNNIKINTYKESIQELMSIKRNNVSNLVQQLIFRKTQLDLSLTKLEECIKNIKNDEDDTLIEPTTIFFDLQEQAIDIQNIFTDVSFLISKDMDAEEASNVKK